MPPGVRRGPVGSRRAPRRPVGTAWRAQGVRTSIVHRYGTVERPVEPHRVPSCQNRVPTEVRRNPIWPDGARRAPTDDSTVPYQCTTDIRTHTGSSGVPMGPPGARQDPTGPRRTAGGTVGPRFIGASPVWAARSSYWRQPWLWYSVTGSQCQSGWVIPKSFHAAHCRTQPRPAIF